jgi:hypothetical protein
MSTDLANELVEARTELICTSKQDTRAGIIGARDSRKDHRE